jgi:hypothetical protein
VGLLSLTGGDAEGHPIRPACFCEHVNHINHNSSSCLNSLFIMFFILQFTFINFIWNRFLINTHRIANILCLFFSQISHNSSECRLYR